ncbi:MAG: type II secretion system F family protein [Candidatus Margulisbacteria bacterium]|jgi:type IV pilus assembly protein PilC|nr:type II secretion system F family protein [Candidatus Margulisiibacteriota bacterium]
MSEFAYKVRDDKGRLVAGRMPGATSGEVVDRLHNLGYTVVSVKPAAAGFALDFSLPSFSRIKTEDYVMLASQLAAMLAAGVALTAALDVIVEQTENPRLRAALQRTSDDVKAGSSLADALRKHHGTFPTLFVNMVAAGEVAGNLEEVLARLSVFMEKQADFQQKVLTAMFYPIILLCFSLAVIILVILTLLPAFVKMFKDAGVPLPGPTQFLYNVNLLVRNYWLFLLLGLSGLFLGLRYFLRTPFGRALFDRLTLDLPVWGTLSRKVAIARIFRTLASLLTAGVPILKALETLEKTTENTVYAGVIREAQHNVSKGGSLAEQLRASGEFPTMAVKMAAVGEEAGSLDKMLAKVADFYELSVDYAVKRLTALMEPFFLVVVGGVVGFILASVIMPIFQMVSTLRR